MPIIIPKPTYSLRIFGLLFAATINIFCATQEKTDPSIAISISAPEHTIRADAELKVEISVTNVSDSNVRLSRDMSGKAELSGFRITVVNADGKQPKIMKYYWERTSKSLPREQVKDINRINLFNSNPGLGLVEPKQVIKYYVIVNDLWDVSAPGEYTIQVSRPDPVTVARITSNKITVTVTN